MESLWHDVKFGFRMLRKRLNALFRPSAQPLLISMFRYDPGKEIAKLLIPVLIMHGSTDPQTK